MEVSVRWVPSELTPADYGPRVLTRRGRKSPLVHCSPMSSPPWSPGLKAPPEFRARFQVAPFKSSVEPQPTFGPESAQCVGP
eukprot:2079406-Pyramimonas_sp.AAC.1